MTEAQEQVRAGAEPVEPTATTEAVPIKPDKIVTGRDRKLAEIADRLPAASDGALGSIQEALDYKPSKDADEPEPVKAGCDPRCDEVIAAHRANAGTRGERVQVQFAMRESAGDDGDLNCIFWIQADLPIGASEYSFEAVQDVAKGFAADVADSPNALCVAIERAIDHVDNRACDPNACFDDRLVGLNQAELKRFGEYLSDSGPVTAFIAEARAKADQPDGVNAIPS